MILLDKYKFITEEEGRKYVLTNNSESSSYSSNSFQNIVSKLLFDLHIMSYDIDYETFKLYLREIHNLMETN